MTVDLSLWESINPASLFAAVAEEDNRRFVVNVMKTLTPDPVWTEQIVTMVESGQIETRCFVSWLSLELQPKTYLEVGVRRGFSMAMVASRAPRADIYAFDMWVTDYGDVGNLGLGFVQSEMEKIGYARKLHFVNGSSHRTLPAFFGSKKASLWKRAELRWRLGQRPSIFDLITIDGDHSLLGAYQDLLDAMPHCGVGGVVVFDDIAPDYSTLDPAVVKAERGSDPYGWQDLLGVWHAVQEKFSNFRYFEYTENPPGIGLAVRLR